MPQNPIERLEHLLASLNVLVEREEMLEKDNLWAEAEDVQQRMMALVEAITPVAQGLQKRQSMPSTLRTQLDSIITRQNLIFAQRAKSMKLLGSQLDELKATRAKLFNLKPVYGKKAYSGSGIRHSTLDAQG